jgi:hypothetical protein
MSDVMKSGRRNTASQMWKTHIAEGYTVGGRGYIAGWCKYVRLTSSRKANRSTSLDASKSECVLLQVWDGPSYAITAVRRPAFEQS